MNLFHKLLLAPAALGLMAPMAASAADMNLAGVKQYASADEQVTSISQFSDVQPTDWAYQALSNLVERYGCVAGYPNGTFQGKKAMTRFEAAALLNACLDRVTEVTDQLKKLMKEFEKELAILKGRVDGLEARVGTLEANQFSTTTKLKGSTYWVFGANSFGGNFAGGATGASATEGGTTFNYDLRLDLDTSFTGKDLLRTRLRAGNFGKSGFGGTQGLVGLNALEVSFEQPAGANIVGIDRLFYQFPLGNGFTFTGGPRVRQDDMLAMWPSAYPADTIIDVFTYAGAPGAYSLNLGGGAGLWWQKDGFNVSANYVSNNANNGTPAAGGVLTSGAGSSTTVQLGYAGSNWGTAFAYTYSQKGASIYGGNATPLAVLASTSGTGTSNNYGLSAYWSPKTAGYVPSISAGWGYSSYDAANTPTTTGGVRGITAAQNWYVGLQWADAFVKGNSLGMAVGQPTFVTAANNGTPQDGNYAWEWWYKFQVTDHIAVTPAIFYLSNPQGATGFAAAHAANLSTTNPLTNFGGLIKTTFKF
ncbi:MAG: hypothetical protein RLZZ374_1756 [Cyanobacteriota bacterium]